jgi:hypothetical protein
MQEIVRELECRVHDIMAVAEIGAEVGEMTKTGEKVRVD